MPVPSKVTRVGSFWDLNRKKTEDAINPTRQIAKSQKVFYRQGLWSMVRYALWSIAGKESRNKHDSTLRECQGVVREAQVDVAMFLVNKQ